MSKLTFQFAFAFSVFLLLIVSFFSYRDLKDFETNAYWVVHTQNVKNEVAYIKNETLEVSRNYRSAFFNNKTNLTALLNEYDSTTNSHIVYLDSLISDNPIQIEAVSQLKGLIKEYMLILQKLSKTIPENTYEELLDSIYEEGIVLEQITSLLEEMRNTENELLKKRTEEVNNAQYIAPITLLSLVVIAICIICFLYINAFSLFTENEKKAELLSLKIEELNNETNKKDNLKKLLQRIFDSSLNGIIAWKAIRNERDEIVDFVFELANYESASLLAYKEAELVGKTMMEVVPGNKSSGLFDKYVKVVETGETFKEAAQYQFDGLDHWFDICAVKNGDGFIVTFSDISNLKRYEKSLLDHQKELESANEELEHFAYISSHDLQEPLRKIRAFGDRLEKTYFDKLDDRGKDYINRMQNASERMQVLITDLLNFSRVNRTEIPFTKVDLNTVVKDVLDILDEEIHNKKAVITSEVLPSISGVEQQMVQLFQNLFSNSLKYSRKDLPAKITVSVREDKEDKPDFWRIDVADNGIGFDPVYKDQIFDIFQRLHGRSEYSGTGIGLAICQKIVLHHNGEIMATALPNEGATFTIYLPKHS